MLVKNKMIKGISYDKIVTTELTKIIGKKEAPYVITLVVNNFLAPFKVLKKNTSGTYVLASLDPNSGDYFVEYQRNGSTNNIIITLNVEGEFLITYAQNSNQL